MNQFSPYLKIAITMVISVTAVGLMAGCGGGITPATPMPLPTPEEVQVAVVPPATPTTAPSPTPPPAILAPDDGCVTCHTDQAMLQKTAKEETVVEPLSEGEG